MKKLILLIYLCCLGCLGYTKPIQQQQPTFEESVDFQEIYITSKNNASLYKLTKLDISLLNRTGRRIVNDLYTRPKKTLRKQTRLKVIAFTNIKRQLNYDAYIVSLNNSLYFIEASDVVDNASIEKQNNLIEGKYNGLKSKTEDLRTKIDSIIQTSKKQCQDSIDYYKRLKIILPTQIDSIENVAKEEYEKLRQAKFDEWYKAQPTSTKQAANRLQINYAKLQDPNSAGGCDYEFYYTNVSNKTIKYLHWTGTVYNAVGDLAYCSIRHYSTYTGRDTGPVKPDFQGGGTWSCIVYNYSADTVRLNSIKIEYMDGTSATINSTDIRRLIDAPARADGFYRYGDSFSRKQKASRPYRDKLESCDKIIRKWQERKDRFNSEFYYLYDDSGYNVYSYLKILNNDYKTLSTNLIQFELENFIK